MHAEQGLGDTLQFIRYVELLKRRGDKVFVEVPGTLMPLLKTSGFCDILAQGTELPPFDVQLPLLSLPGIFRTTPANLPAPLGYLTAEARMIETWRARLPAFEGFKVGIHWQGRRAFALDHQRSIPLRSFAPLAAVAGVRLFSLQKGEGTEQLAELAGSLGIHDFGPELDVSSGAFMDTAAILAQSRSGDHLRHGHGSPGRRSGCAGVAGAGAMARMAVVPGPCRQPLVSHDATLPPAYGRQLGRAVRQDGRSGSPRRLKSVGLKLLSDLASLS